MTQKKIIFFFFLLFNTTIFAQTETAIRGVWVPAPKFTSVLHSYKNVENFVSLLDSLNFNTIFVVSYAETKTIYPSKVIKSYTNAKTIEQSNLLSPYLKSYNLGGKSISGDPIEDLINLAHKRNIKVFFWYEYGFMGATKPITSENPLFANHPDWLGINNENKPANYHNKDFYFNAYNPKVQDFLIKLIKEGIKRYPNVDGVQGDDRMPAMPKNSGYDTYTISKYKKEHNGQLPPKDFEDVEWVNWRIDLLNNFGKKLYQEVKQKNPNVMVSFAPNPYPWSKENLMQDWPQWIKSGICDLLAVQCYRYNADAYKNTLTEVVKYINQNNPKQIFAPGIILMEGGKIKMNPDLLKEQININRNLGINGEIFFYNEALKDQKIQTVFKELYPKKVSFPSQ